MDYHEAVAQVEAGKVHDNYIQIGFGYSVKLLLPFTDGVAMLGHMRNAEQMNDSYSNPGLQNFKTDLIDVKIMSARTYKNHKVAALLGLTFEEVEDLEKNPPEK